MTDRKRGGTKDPIDEGFLIPRVAALLVLGKSTTEIADTLNIGFNTVKKIAARDETRSVVKDMSDSVLNVAKAVIRKKTADMTDLAVEVLMEHLKEERSLDAVKLVFKVAGALTDEPAQKTQGSGTIQVIMPGAHVEKPAIEVPSEADFSLGREQSDSNDPL